MHTVAPRALSSLVALSMLLLGSGGLLGSQHAYANGEILPGVDLFKTDPVGTSFAFETTPLPPGFFGPGCSPFTGRVNFGGVPLETFNGKDTSDADTIVRRPAPASLPGPDSTTTIPIEIVALNLVSVEPITVTCGGKKTQWNVQMALSVVPQQPGTMTIRVTHPNGGTFDSSLPVTPKFIFTRVGGDGGGKPIPPIILDTGRTGVIGGIIEGSPLYMFQQTGAPWVFGTACPPGILRVPDLTSNFCASATHAGPVQTTATSGGTNGSAMHTYQPATHTQVPMCNGKLATVFVDRANRIVGGPQNGLLYTGVLRGTPGDDVMVATDGPDVVIGRGGNDTICTLDRPDHVITLAGNDWIDAGEGDNTVNAGRGDDTVRSGRGNDKLDCGPDRDTASPGAGVNHLSGCEVILP